MKKKQVKSNQQFPNIFRFIPESKFLRNIVNNKKIYYFLIGCAFSVTIVFIAIILFMFINIGLISKKLININSERGRLEADLGFWKSVAQKYDGYKDSYFQIALVEYKLGDIAQAKIYVEKALYFDPYFDNAKILETLINKKR